MQALILAGGSGTRFWPLSRSRRPKQLLALEGARSLLQQTVDRLSPLVLPSDIWICTTAALAEAVREQVPEVPADHILCEPEGRNTGPAIAWALGFLPPAQQNEVVAVLPADHRLADDRDFRETLARAGAAAAERVVAVGIQPRRPETGYGYLELGDSLGPGLHAVNSFREKPDLATAEAYCQSGRHLWNGGIFVFRPSLLLQHLASFEPTLAAELATLAAERHRTAEIYPRLKKISIDYAVMERLGPGEIATVELESGWSDLGSWEALAEVLPADPQGNHVRGDVLTLEASGNLLVADQGQITVLGVQGLVVVRTGDNVLVMPLDRSQDVRELVALLDQQGRKDLL